MSPLHPLRPDWASASGQRALRGLKGEFADEGDGQRATLSRLRGDQLDARPASAFQQ